MCNSRIPLGYAERIAIDITAHGYFAEEVEDFDGENRCGIITDAPTYVVEACYLEECCLDNTKPFDLKQSYKKGMFVYF